MYYLEYLQCNDVHYTLSDWVCAGIIVRQSLYMQRTFADEIDKSFLLDNTLLTYPTNYLHWLTILSSYIKRWLSL